MGPVPVLVPWVLHRKIGPRIQLWKPDLDSSMSWTVETNDFFPQDKWLGDVTMFQKKHGDFEKHVEHVESTFRWVWSSIRSTTMLKMRWHVTKKPWRSSYLLPLPFWTLTEPKNPLPEEMQVHEDGETVRHALLPHWFVNSDWRCKMLYGTNTQRTYAICLTPFKTFTKTPNPAVVDMQSLPFASVQPSEIKDFGPSSRYEVVEVAHIVLVSMWSKGSDLIRWSQAQGINEEATIMPVGLKDITS